VDLEPGEFVYRGGDLSQAADGCAQGGVGNDDADPGNVTLGHKSVQRWNLPDGWVISSRPSHPALVSEDDFVAAQDINAARGPVPRGEPVLRRYLLAGLLACGVCGRRMESAWTNGKPAYRCRHDRTTPVPVDTLNGAGHTGTQNWQARPCGRRLHV